MEHIGLPRGAIPTATIRISLYRDPCMIRITRETASLLIIPEIKLIDSDNFIQIRSINVISPAANIKTFTLFSTPSRDAELLSQGFLKIPQNSESNKEIPLIHVLYALSHYQQAVRVATQYTSAPAS